MAGIYHTKIEMTMSDVSINEKLWNYYDRQGLNFGQYDGNNDGVIDCVYLFIWARNTGWGRSTWWVV